MEVRPAVESFEALGIITVGLLKLNIEGGEYLALPSLLESGWLPRIHWIKVQYILAVDDEGARNAIRRELIKTHGDT